MVDPLQHATAGVQHATCNMPSPADAKRHGNMGPGHGRTASVAGAKAGELKLMPATVSGGGACSVPRISSIPCTMLRAGMGPWCSIVYVCWIPTVPPWDATCKRIRCTNGTAAHLAVADLAAVLPPQLLQHSTAQPTVSPCRILSECVGVVAQHRRALPRRALPRLLH